VFKVATRLGPSPYWLIAFLIHPSPTPHGGHPFFGAPSLGIPQMLMNFLPTPWNTADFFTNIQPPHGVSTDFSEFLLISWKFHVVF
jgi:hypothetical protein